MISAVGNLHGRIATGSIIVNDYVIELTPIENGYTLTVTRGSEVQTMTLYGVGEELLEQIRQLIDQSYSMQIDGTNLVFDRFAPNGGAS